MKYCNQCQKTTKEDKMIEFCGLCMWHYGNKRQ